MYNTDMFNELYVCCSRVRSLENIFFIGSLNNCFWINRNEPLKSEKTIVTDSSKLLAEIYSSNGNGLNKFFNLLNGYLQETGEQKADQNCALDNILIHRFGPKFAHLNLEDLTERQLAFICNTSKTSIRRWIKEGLTREQIYLKFNPDRDKKVSEITLSFGASIQNHYNTCYKYVINIKGLDDFKKAVKYDHCAGIFRDGKNTKGNIIQAHRCERDWVRSDVFILDFDDNALPIEQFIALYKKYGFYIVTSKSHLKEKHGVIGPRYHVYFPIRECDNRNQYKLLLKKLHKFFNQTCDKQCSEASRYFNGNPEAELYYNEGVSIEYDIKDIEISENEAISNYIPTKEVIKDDEEYLGNESTFYTDNGNYKESYICAKMILSEQFFDGIRNDVIVKGIPRLIKNGIPITYLISKLKKCTKESSWGENKAYFECYYNELIKNLPENIWQ
jgi:hypothetical protein